jgi:hypothetical protein
MLFLGTSFFFNGDGVIDYLMSVQHWWNNERRKRKTCPSATLSTTNSTWNGLA